jgi:hypothetical protein
MLPMNFLIWLFLLLFPKPAPEPTLEEMLAEMVGREIEDYHDSAAVKVKVITAVRQYYATVIRDLVAGLAPLSDNYQAIEAECREQLRRWPALKTDPEMQAKVSRVILSSFHR